MHTDVCTCAHIRACILVNLTSIEGSFATIDLFSSFETMPYTNTMDLRDYGPITQVLAKNTYERISWVGLSFAVCGLGTIACQLCRDP